MLQVTVSEASFLGGQPFGIFLRIASLFLHGYEVEDRFDFAEY